MVNPVLRRELLGILYSRRTFLVQLAFFAALTLLLLVRWPSDAMVDTTASQSRNVFRLFGYSLLVLLLVFTPAFAAVSVVKEKRQGTLQLLLNSPMNAWQIYVGKLAGVVLFVCWLLLISTPVLAACYLMGGIGLGSEILILYLLMMLMAVEIAAVGLFASTVSQSHDSAMKLCYGLVLLLSVLSMLPRVFAQGKEGLFATVAYWFAGVSPVAAVMEILGDSAVTSQGFLPRAGELTTCYFVFSPLLIVALGLLTVSRLNHRLFDRSRATGRITDDQDGATKIVRRFAFIIDPQRRSRAISRLINPVLVKEIRTRRFGRLHWILRLVAFCAVVSIVITYTTAQESQVWGVEMVGGVMVILQLSLILFLMPAISAGLISTELESGGWALLQMTPMWTSRIVMGKMFSAIIPAGLVLLGTLPGYLILLWIEPELSGQIQRVMISLLLASMLAVLVGAAVSSLVRRTAVATISAYASLVGGVVISFLFWLGKNAPFGHSTVESVLKFNLVAAALADMRTAGFADYRLTPDAWYISIAISLFAFAVLCFRVFQLTRPR